jgi:epoxyqueuosine reductase QueG
MHPEYGLWHAYRGALLFDAEFDLPAPGAAVHLCDACTEKPCLKSCPVDAYDGSSFDHVACLAYVRGASGAACRGRGCLDRNACPYGTRYRYGHDEQAFHMAAFAR